MKKKHGKKSFSKKSKTVKDTRTVSSSNKEKKNDIATNGEVSGKAIGACAGAALGCIGVPFLRAAMVSLNILLKDDESESPTSQCEPSELKRPPKK